MTEIKIRERIKRASDVFFALEKCGWDTDGAASFLDSIPDAKDYVQVVRCENCIHRSNVVETLTTFAKCDKLKRFTKANDFCSEGERKS